MFWHIMTVICLVAVIVGIVLCLLVSYHPTFELSMDHFFPMCVIAVAGILAIFFSVITISDTVGLRQEIAVYQQLKEDYEQLEISKDSIEYAAIYTKVVELNEKLYNRQYAAKHRPFFYSLNDEILALEPIELNINNSTNSG